MKKNKIFLKKTIIFIILFICALYISWPLFNQYSLFTHDGDFHVGRIVSSFFALEEGQFLPRIVSNWTAGFGYSWNLFYPPLITYFGVLIKPWFTSFTDTLEFMIIVLNFITIYTMYGFMKELTKNNKIAIISAVIYTAAPYRITNMYVRMAVGEIITMSFLPLLFWGLHNLLYEDKKKHYFITIAASVILLSHNISSMIVFFISSVYAIFNYKKIFDKIVIKKLFVNILFIIGITSFFFFPLIESKNTVEYACFEKGFMMNREAVHMFSIRVKRLFVDSISYSYDNGNVAKDSFNMSLGLPIIFGIMLLPSGIYTLFKNKEKNNEYFYFIFSGIICVFMTTFYFPWHKIPDVFSFIQFPFRMLMPSVFLLSAAIGLTINYRFKTIDWYSSFTIIGFILIYTYPFFLNLNFDEWHSEYPILVDDISYQACAFYEYLPTKAKTNLEKLIEREKSIIICDGNAELKRYGKENTHLYCEIVNNQSDKLVLELPYIYYIGYEVTFNNEILKQNESNLGLIEVEIDNKQEGILEVNYTGTKIMNITQIVSIFSSIIFILYVISINIFNNKESFIGLFLKLKIWIFRERQ